MIFSDGVGSDLTHTAVEEFDSMEPRWDRSVVLSWV